MPLDILTQGLLAPDTPVPINISQLIDLLRSRQDTFSLRLSDALYQIQQAIGLIWITLQSPDEILLDSIVVTDGTGALGTTVSSGGMTSAETGTGTKSVALTATNGLKLADAFSGATGEVDLTVVHDTILFTFKRNGGTVASWTFSPGGNQMNLPAGAQILINSQQVLSDRLATVTAVAAGPAGAAYTATEQSMLNQLKTAVNLLIVRMQTQGTIG